MATTASRNGYGHERRFSYGLVDDADLSDHSGTFSCEQQVKHPRDENAELLPDPELDMFDLVEKRYQLRQGLLEPSYVNKAAAKVIETSLSDYFDVEEQDEYYSDGREALELLTGKKQSAVSDNEVQSILSKLNMEGNMIFDTADDDYSYLDSEAVQEASTMAGTSGRHHSQARARRHKAKALDIRVHFEDVETLEQILLIEDDAVRNAEYRKYLYSQEMNKCMVPIDRSPVDVKAELRIFPEDTSGHEDQIRRLNERIHQLEINYKKRQQQTESSDSVLRLLQSAGLTKILSRTPTPTPPPTLRQKAASEEPEKGLGSKSSTRSISRGARSTGSRRSFDFGASRRTKLKRHNSQPPAQLYQWTPNPVEKLIAQTASIRARASEYEAPVPDQISDLVEAIEKICEENWMICPVNLSQATQQQLAAALEKAKIFAIRRMQICEIVDLHDYHGPAMANFYNAKYIPIEVVKPRGGEFMTYEELNAVFVKTATYEKMLSIYFLDQEKAKKQRQEEEEAAKKKEAAEKLAHQRQLLQEQKMQQKQEQASKLGPSTPPPSHGGDPVKKTVPKSGKSPQSGSGKSPKNGGKSPPKQKVGGVQGRAKFHIGQLEKMVDNSLIGQITQQGKETPPSSMPRLPSPSKSPTRPSLAGAFDPPPAKPAQTTVSSSAAPSTQSSQSQSQPPTGPKNAFGQPLVQQTPPTGSKNAFGQPLNQPSASQSQSGNGGAFGQPLGQSSASQSQSGKGGAFGGGMGAFGQPSGASKPAGAFGAFGKPSSSPKPSGGLGSAFSAPSASPSTSTFGTPPGQSAFSGPSAQSSSVKTAPASQSSGQSPFNQQQQQNTNETKQSQSSQSANTPPTQAKAAQDTKVNDESNPEIECYKRILTQMKAIKNHLQQQCPDTFKSLGPQRAAINRSVGQISIEEDHTNQLVTQVKHALFTAAQSAPKDGIKMSGIMLPHMIQDAQQRNLPDPDIQVVIVFLLYQTVKAVFNFMEDNHEKKPMIRNQMCYFTYRIFCEPWYRDLNFSGILVARIYRHCPMIFGRQQREIDEFLEPSAILLYGVSKYCSTMQYEKNVVEALPLMRVWTSVADLINREAAKPQEGRALVLKVFVEMCAFEFVRRWKNQGFKLIQAIEKVAKPEDDHGRLLKDAVEKLLQG